jgi:hypothetical protein
MWPSKFSVGTIMVCCTNPIIIKCNIIDQYEAISAECQCSQLKKKSPTDSNQILNLVNIVGYNSNDRKIRN